MILKDPATFWAKVDVRGSEECWPWTMYQIPSGYGLVEIYFGPSRKKHGTGAHRLALMLTGVRVPHDLMVLHHCDNPPCCNPAHLYVGTAADNARDAWARGRGRNMNAERQRAVTHCPQGHEYAPPNVYVRPCGRRGCRACSRDRSRAYRARRAA